MIAANAEARNFNRRGNCCGLTCLTCVASVRCFPALSLAVGSCGSTESSCSVSCARQGSAGRRSRQRTDACGMERHVHGQLVDSSETLSITRMSRKQARAP